MIKESVTPQDVVDLLNNLIRLDPEAVRALMDCRVPCNDEFADHPTVQCGLAEHVRKRTPDHNLPDDANYTVGPLGLLNGLFGIDPKGWGYIAAVYQNVCDECVADSADGQKYGDTCKKCGQGKIILGHIEEFRINKLANPDS